MKYTGRGGHRLHRQLQDCHPGPQACIPRARKSTAMIRAGHLAPGVELRDAYSVLVARPEGKRPLPKPKHRGDDNIRSDGKESKGSGLDSSG